VADEQAGFAREVLQQVFGAKPGRCHPLGIGGINFAVARMFQIDEEEHFVISAIPVTSGRFRPETCQGEQKGEPYPLAMKVIWRVSQYLFAHGRLFALTLFFAVLMVGSMIAVPRVVQSVLQSVQENIGSDPESALNELWIGILLIAGLYLASEAFNGLRILVNNTLEQRVLLTMRAEIHSKLLRLPVSFYDQRKSGDISSRVIEDVANVERALLDGCDMGIRSMLMIVGVSGWLFYTNAFLASFVFLPVPILILAGFLYAKGSRKVWKRVRESSGELNSLLVEDIQGNRLIQTFALQEREETRFDGKAQDLRAKTIRAMKRWAIYNPATSYLTNLGYVAVFGVGGYLIMTNSASFGFPQLVTFLIWTQMLYAPVGQIHGINHMLAAGAASGERVFEILDAKEDVQSPPDPVPFPAAPLTVSFAHVDFCYEGRPNALENLNLELPAGKVTALVGHTGAGKSTIANLAMRSYDVTAGAVTINGIDVREVDLVTLHGQVGHVAQDPFLFEGSVRDNMLLARADADEEAMIAALEGASSWEFVQRLPEGLDTNIGEKGIRLSQGEKQRLTIARVLLKNPPFVILDEATASVDTITERQIQNALDNLMAARTVLVIAHRLSTVRKADQIVVLDHGKIVEQGTHDDLCLQEGHYARLWAYQRDLIPENVGVG